MSNKMWEALVEHAKTCVLSGKLYVYYPDEYLKNVGVVFNNIYELCGLIAGGEYHSVDSLSDDQKGYVDSLVKKAYDNWMHVIEYDGKSLMSLNENKNSDSPQNDLLTASQNHSNSFNHQLNMPSLSASISSEQPDLDPGLNVRGYNDNSGSMFPNVSASVQLSDASFQNHSVGASQQALPSGNYNMLPLGPQPSFLAPGTSNLASYSGADDFFTEEIRLRSHEILGNQDMQQLLHVFNSGGSGRPPANVITEDSYPYTSQQAPDMPSAFGFNEDRSRSGKAVVGWLKLKAALRWGIFIRKKAAERRAQIVELDDL
nr:calmodulin-binding protein 60 D-like [Ipomoea batatas]